MICKPEVIDKKQINNGQVAYRIVCCGEKCGEGCTRDSHKCEDSWHSLAVEIEDHDSRLELRKAEVAARHGKMKAWREKHGK